MAIPTVTEIRNFLEGYCLKTTGQTIVTGNTTAASPVITNVLVSTIDLKPLMRVFGAGIPAGALILSVDSPSQMTLDVAATATGAAVAMSVTFFTSVTDDWIQQMRDGFVIPFVEEKTAQSYSAVKQAVEYYSGNGGSVLIVDRRPIVSLDDIDVVSGADRPLGVSVSNIEVIAEEGILKATWRTEERVLLGQFPRGTKNIKVTYSYGFASMPEEVKQAVIYFTCNRILGHIANKTGGGSLNVQAFSRNYGGLGKYSNERQELSSMAFGAINGRMLSVVGG